jgi:hypothetical protein
MSSQEPSVTSAQDEKLARTVFCNAKFDEVLQRFHAIVYIESPAIAQ